MRKLKLGLLLELELGCVWLLLLVGLPQGDAMLGAFWLFPWIYAVHSVVLLVGLISFWKRPETRVLSAVVLVTPWVLLVAPAIVRTLAGGPVAVPPAAWLVLVGLPLGACLLLPHHVATFMPDWALRSRWLNVSTVVVLSVLIVPWACLFIMLLVSYLTGASVDTVNDVDIRLGTTEASMSSWLIATFVLAVITTIVAACTLLTSYVALFQRVDRSQQKLRVVQLVQSLVLLVMAMPALAIGLTLLAVAMVNPG